jgi:hypothetical protein
MVVRTVRRLGFVATVLVAVPALVHAGTLGLAWDASPGATGYRVHYGASTGNYTVIQDVGNVTETTLTGLTDCAPSYFAVTAYNGVGESDLSNEVSSHPRPSVSSLTPSAVMQGGQQTLRIQGTNFTAGAAVSVGNPNVFLTGVTVSSCNQIQLIATVEPTAAHVRAAEVGSFTVSVTEPNGLVATVEQAFEVRIDPARFDVNRSDDTTAGRLDGKDTAWISKLHAARETDGNYDPDVDLNGDGWIDGDDLAYVAANFGLCWAGSAWNLSACPTELK